MPQIIYLNFKGFFSSYHVFKVPEKVGFGNSGFVKVLYFGHNHCVRRLSCIVKKVEKNKIENKQQYNHIRIKRFRI